MQRIFLVKIVPKFWKFGFLAASLVLGGLIFIAGCSRGNPVAKGVDRETRVRMNILATLYSDFLDNHRGKPPKDTEAFRGFLESRAADLEFYKKTQNIDGVEALLTSARDGQPFTIVCGKPVEISDSPGNFWAASEQTGVDGIRMAVRLAGGVDLLDAEQFAQEFK